MRGSAPFEITRAISSVANITEASELGRRWLVEKNEGWRSPGSTSKGPKVKFLHAHCHFCSVGNVPSRSARNSRSFSKRNFTTFPLYRTSWSIRRTTGERCVFVLYFWLLLQLLRCQVHKIVHQRSYKVNVRGHFRFSAFFISLLTSLPFLGHFLEITSDARGLMLFLTLCYLQGVSRGSTESGVAEMTVALSNLKTVFRNMNNVVSLHFTVVLKDAYLRGLLFSSCNSLVS